MLFEGGERREQAFMLERALVRRTGFGKKEHTGREATGEILPGAALGTFGSLVVPLKTQALRSRCKSPAGVYLSVWVLGTTVPAYSWAGPDHLPPKPARVWNRPKLNRKWSVERD